MKVDPGDNASGKQLGTYDTNRLIVNNKKSD